MAESSDYRHGCYSCSEEKNENCLPEKEADGGKGDADPSRSLSQTLRSVLSQLDIAHEHYGLLLPGKKETQTVREFEADGVALQ